MKESNFNYPGSLFLELLTILFIGLKLTGHIDWSWWWVLSPLWVPLISVVSLALVFGILIGIFKGLKGVF